MNGSLKQEHEAVQVIANLFDKAFREGHGVYGFDDAAAIVDNVRLLNSHFIQGVPGILAKLGEQISTPAPVWDQPQDPISGYVANPGNETHELAKTIDPETIPGTSHKIAKPRPSRKKTKVE